MTWLLPHPLRWSSWRGICKPLHSRLLKILGLLTSEMIMSRAWRDFVPLLIALVLLACGEATTPTQPDSSARTVQSLAAAAANSWTARAASPFSEEFYGFDLGTAPNAAGESIVYALGGTDAEGGTGFSVQAYNVATNTWTRRLSRVFVFDFNGIAKIGSRLYFSGGFDYSSGDRAASNRLWAYDYSQDRMIAKAGLPIFSAEGVSGVIDGKLYVLPGICSGDGYPNPGYCVEERTRRFYRYNPVTNSWTSRRQAPHYHRQGAAAVMDGKLYVVGGFKDFHPVADLDVYDPATNSWQTLAPIPTAGSAIGAVLGGQFYVLVQQFSGTSSYYLSYAYNRSTNQWKAKAAPSFDQTLGGFRGGGALTKVTLGGGAGLFMVTADQSALYTP
jgi:hypothetical protein